MPLTEVRDLLQVGHALPFRVLDAQHRLLLNQGQPLASEAQFEALVERGAWAERGLVEAERQARAAAVQPAPAAAPAPSLFDAWEKLLWQFDNATRALVRRQADASVLPPCFVALQSLVGRDADIALFLCTRQDDRRFALYALTHSIHCAVLALLTGRRLGWPEERVAAVTCAALTMNLGMLELQAAMAEQDLPPTKKQLEQIRAHPHAAAQLLREAGVTGEEWLIAVEDHHEHAGGGGYPRGAAEVGDLAQLLRAADVYMAKISPRAGRPAMSPQLAVRQLFQQHPGDPLAMAMIQTLGVHPPGCLLQLQSGEVAVVIRRPPRGTHPLVATLSDTHGRPVAETHRRDTADPAYAVKGPLEDTKAYPRVLPERVYGLVNAPA